MAVIVAVLEAVTPLVVTIKVAVVLPVSKFRVAGTDAYELLLDSVTEIPPTGAGAFRATVAVEEAPPVTDAGFSDTEESATGVIVSVAVLLTLL